MSDVLRVCAYYNDGPSFLARLKSLRSRYPKARVCAMVPAGHCLPETAARWVDEVIETKEPRYSVRRPAACWRLLQRLRRERFDVLVVLYDSLQLGMLAALSGARHRECWDLENRIVPLPGTVPGVVLRVLWRPIRGWIRFPVLWLTVFCTSWSGDDFRETKGREGSEPRGVKRKRRRAILPTEKSS